MVRTARSVLKRWSLPVEPRSPAVNRGARHIETANGGRNAGIKRILNNCLTKASDLWYSIHRVTASFVWFFLVIKLYHKLLGLLLFFYHLCLISIVIIQCANLFFYDYIDIIPQKCYNTAIKNTSNMIFGEQNSFRNVHGTLHGIYGKAGRSGGRSLSVAVPIRNNRKSRFTPCNSVGNKNFISGG